MRKAFVSLEAILFVALMVASCQQTIAQTIPFGEINRLFGCVSISHNSDGDFADVLTPNLETISLIDYNDIGERNKFYQAYPCNKENSRRIAVRTHTTAEIQNVLEVREKRELLLMLNDVDGHERRFAVLSVWQRAGESLTLKYFFQKAFVTSLGYAELEQCAFFPDSSFLVVVRTNMELFHTLLFLRMKHGTFQFLMKGNPFYIPWHPNYEPKDHRGTGFTLSKDFSKHPIVKIAGLKRVSTDAGFCDVIDEKATPRSINLWKLARKLEKESPR